MKQSNTSTRSNGNGGLTSLLPSGGQGGAAGALSVSLPSGTASSLEATRKEALRRRKERQQEVRLTNNEKEEEGVDSIQAEEEVAQSALVVEEEEKIEDEEREIMPFVVSELNDDGDDNVDGEHKHAEIERGEDDDDENSDDDDDDEDSLSSEVSLTPPPSMPVVVVNLNKLVGYVPRTRDEYDELKNQLQEALLGTPLPLSPEQSGNASMTTNTTEEADAAGGGAAAGAEGAARRAGADWMERHEGGNRGDGVSLDFVSRTDELFESGIAVHSDTSKAVDHGGASAVASNQQQQQTIVVPYPEFLPAAPQPPTPEANRSSSSGTTELLNTIKVWKSLLQPHPIPIVQRLLSHLSNCSRSLPWKYSMKREIHNLSKSEFQSKLQRTQREELQHWRSSKRRNELNKLYDVRETFQLRLDMSQLKLDQLVKVREEKVIKELRRRKECGLGYGGVDGLDLGVNGMEFLLNGEEEELLRRRSDAAAASLLSEEDEEKEDPYEGEDEDDSAEEGEDEFSEEEEEEGDNNGELEQDEFPSVDASDVATSITTTPSSSLASNTNRSSSSRRSSRQRRLHHRRRQQKLQSQTEAARMSSLRHQFTQAQKEECEVREMYKSTDERMAEAVVLSLQNRLNHVDELLERLQEEEWADEEEGLVDTFDGNDEDWGRKSNDDDQEANEEEENTESVSSTMTLLDQILAMILGTLPRSAANISEEEHYQFVKEEHDTIVKGWKEEFGRLPPSPSGLDNGGGGNHGSGSSSGATHSSSGDDSGANRSGRTNKEEGTRAGQTVGEEKSHVTPLDGKGGKKDITMATTTTTTTATSKSSTMSSSSNLRSVLGINENDVTDDWDDVEDWDALLLPGLAGSAMPPPSEESATPSLLSSSVGKDKLETEENKGHKMPQPPKPRKMGLRPGGKV